MTIKTLHVSPPTPHLTTCHSVPSHSVPRTLILSQDTELAPASGPLPFQIPPARNGLNPNVVSPLKCFLILGDLVYILTPHPFYFALVLNKLNLGGNSFRFT